MIADTVMGVFELEALAPGWFHDEARVRRVVDAILDTRLGALMSYAGVVRKAKAAPSRDAIAALIATGKDGMYAIQDAARPRRAYVTLTISANMLGLETRVFEPELSARRASVLDDVAAIGAAARASGALSGLVTGWVRPLTESAADYVVDRSKPRASRRHEAMRSLAVVDLIDVAFHTGSGRRAKPAEVTLARSSLPPGARREEHDGLVTIRWADDPTDKASLDRACEAHEDWIDQHLPTG